MCNARLGLCSSILCIYMHILHIISMRSVLFFLYKVCSKRGTFCSVVQVVESWPFEWKFVACTRRTTASACWKLVVIFNYSTLYFCIQSSSLFVQVKDRALFKSDFFCRHRITCCVYFTPTSVVCSDNWLLLSLLVVYILILFYVFRSSFCKVTWCELSVTFGVCMQSSGT